MTTPLRTTLANGLTVIAVENPVADIVSARIFVKAGQRCETPATAGIFDLLTAVIVKGTADKSALQIAEVVESVGAGLGARCRFRLQFFEPEDGGG